MRWFLKLQVDYNLIVINYKLNDNFKNHPIFKRTQEELLALLNTCFHVNELLEMG
jgi:hypothetical protein